MGDGSKVTVWYQNYDLMGSGELPIAGIARLYGVAKVYKSGPEYDKVWERLIDPERQRDPDKGGFAVLIKVERAEDLLGQPIT
jgi:hypothetical protein